MYFLLGEAKTEAPKIPHVESLGEHRGGGTPNLARGGGGPLEVKAGSGGE